jgi:hypothetical protein
MPQRVSGEVLIFLLHTKNDLLSPCKHRPKKDQWSNKTTQEKNSSDFLERERLKDYTVRYLVSLPWQPAPVKEY